MRATMPQSAAPIAPTNVAAEPPPGVGSADARRSRYASISSTHRSTREEPETPRGEEGSVAPVELVSTSTACLNKTQFSVKAQTHVQTLEQTRGDVKDLGLADAGKSRIEWAASFMPVLAQIRERFAKTKPLAGVRIGACLHVITETANLMLALKAGGAEIALCASNPLSTQDDVAAALCTHYEIPTYAIKGEDEGTYYSHIESVIASKPHMSMDDGCDLVTTIYTKHNALLKEMIGGCEETTTGVIRLHAMEKDGVLPYPVIAVNDALTKHMFDNRYGPRQSTIDGVIRATNALIAGSP